MNKNYPKIDVYVNGKYEASTTLVKTCREAKERYCNVYDLSPVYNKITCIFSK